MVDSINFGEYTFCLNRIAYWLISNNKTFKTRDVYGYQNVASTKKDLINVIKNRGRNVKLDNSAFIINEFVECAIFDNTDLSFMPSYVTCSDGKTKLYLDTYVDMANRVSAYEVTNGRSPNIVYIRKENVVNTKGDSFLQKVYNAFGYFDTIDGFLEKIAGKGYAYYYNSQYNTDQTIQRILNRKGVNCTDVTQLMYRIALALGYKDVQIIHVKCRGGDGHVRIRMRDKQTGNFFYRDGASCLNGEGVTSNWCMNGTVLAYNPSWIFSDIYA